MFFFLLKNGEEKKKLIFFEKVHGQSINIFKSPCFVFSADCHFFPVKVYKSLTDSKCFFLPREKKAFLITHLILAKNCQKKIFSREIIKKIFPLDVQIRIYEHLKFMKLKSDNHHGNDMDIFDGKYFFAPQKHTYFQKNVIQK